MKKFFLLQLLFMICFQIALFAQETGSDGKKEKILERPNTSGAEKADAFASKAFDTYDESRSISSAIEFIKVIVKEVPDKGDGVTTEVMISNGKGEKLSKAGALAQFAELLGRTVKQNENIKNLAEAKKGASEEVKTQPLMTKAKASKAIAKGGEAEEYVIKETKKQVDLINQQISTIKAMKGN